MNVEKTRIEPTYKKPNGAWSLNTQSVVPESLFVVEHQAIVMLPAGEVAGNHRHVEQEVLIGLGAGAIFLWQDEKGTVHREPMNPDGELMQFFIPSLVPHAVVNESNNEPVILYEYCDKKDRQIERVDPLEITQ